jgi:hypothetical protein
VLGTISFYVIQFSVLTSANKPGVCVASTHIMYSVIVKKNKELRQSLLQPVVVTKKE